MTINGGNRVVNNVQSVGGSMNMQSDSVSKSIQDQIVNAQKQLQELGANKDMTPEEKMKKRQEIQQEINNLNQQLRQRQIEKRKEQQAKAAPEKGTNSNYQKGNVSDQKAGLSTGKMQAMISADSSIKQAKVQGSVAAQMEGRAGVLKVEIKLDGSRGGDTASKEAELAEVEQKAEGAANAQLGTLAEANQAMTEAAEADQADNKKDSGHKNSKTEHTADDRRQTGEVSQPGPEKKGVETDKQKPETGASDENAALEQAQADPRAVTQKHVDIRL
ncbi:MAG: FlxA-like family protein [Acetatifactor sp.]|nr:FlxA-like family protein [Acetatifactor sp.]